MTNLPDRIRQRIAATGKSYRRASMDGGLSQEAVSTILRNPQNSPTLETVQKLALGLETTPEWLAYGISLNEEQQHSNGASASPASEPPRTYTSPTHGKTYIQVSPDVLSRLVSGALQNENIPAEEADEYANAVLLSIEARATLHVVRQIEAIDHKPLGSPRPMRRDRS